MPIKQTHADRISRLILKQFKREIRQARQSFLNQFELNKPAFVVQRAERMLRPDSDASIDEDAALLKYKQALKYMGLE